MEINKIIFNKQRHDCKQWYNSDIWWTYDYKLAKEFNEYYVNVVEKSGRSKPVKLGASEIFSDNEKIFDDTFESYKVLPNLPNRLYTATNYCLHQGVSRPKNTKIASITLLDKGKPNNYEISNYRPVSILNSFPKICEKVIKNQLISYFDKVFPRL